MPNVWALLAAYALAFGLQNDKVPWVSQTLRHIPVIEQMLACIFCTGFHCGWVVWLLTWGATGHSPDADGHALPSLLLWALSSAAFSYVVDTGVQKLES